MLAIIGGRHGSEVADSLQPVSTLQQGSLTEQSIDGFSLRSTSHSLSFPFGTCVSVVLRRWPTVGNKSMSKFLILKWSRCVVFSVSMQRGNETKWRCLDVALSRQSPFSVVLSVWTRVFPFLFLLHCAQSQTNLNCISQSTKLIYWICHTVEPQCSSPYPLHTHTLPVSRIYLHYVPALFAKRWQSLF